MKAIVIAFALLFTTPAWALYRCEINGKVEYRDTACPAGKQSIPKIIDDTPTKADQIRAKIREIEDKQHDLKEKMARQKAVRCDQLYRDLVWTQKKAFQYKGDDWWANRAINDEQNYQLECEDR